MTKLEGRNKRTQIRFLSDVVVALLDLKVPILFDSGVPVVLWYLLGMVSWLSIRKSSVAFCVLRPLVFIGVVKLLFFLVAGPLRHCLALLFYPIARHQCRGVLPVLCQSVQLACSSRYL